jgi:transposase InsO family protein
LDALLDQWIASESPGIRSTNRARKRKQLRGIIERRRLMTNDTTMARNLMLLNPNMTKQDVLEEGGKRYNRRYLPIKGKAEE